MNATTGVRSLFSRAPAPVTSVRRSRRPANRAVATPIRDEVAAMPGSTQAASALVARLTHNEELSHPDGGGW
jgi:hypothetical protein